MKSLEGDFKSPTRGRFVLVLEVPSDGGAASEVTGIDWELWHGPDCFASGMERVSRPLPAGGGTVNFELPVAPMDPVVLDSPSWTMGIRGRLVAQRGGRERAIRFKEVRVVPVRLTPPKVERNPE